MNTPHVDYVGLHEIAQRSGVHISQASIWPTTPGFPEPVIDNLAAGPIWVWGPIRHWLHEHQFRSDVDLD